MITKRWTESIQGKEWLLLWATALAVASVLLKLLAHQAFGGTDFETLLWAVYLGSLTLVVSFVGFVLLSIELFMDLWRAHKQEAAVNQLSSAFRR